MFPFGALNGLFSGAKRPLVSGSRVFPLLEANSAEANSSSWQQQAQNTMQVGEGRVGRVVFGFYFFSNMYFFPQKIQVFF